MSRGELVFGSVFGTLVALSMLGCLAYVGVFHRRWSEPVWGVCLALGLVALAELFILRAVLANISELRRRAKEKHGDAT